tara:strand:- start:20068 stop:20433 length:366 start_codon:yes stop_codon:yes gene_type:complete
MISSSEYSVIVSSIAEAEDASVSAGGRVTAMRNTIATSSLTATDIERTNLDRGLEKLGQTITREYVQAQTVLSLIEALQVHIVHHYGDVNTFLSDNSILVPQTFATLSATAGYEINAGNIE